MPAVYAHECFGRAVAAQLDGELAEVIRRYDAPFQIGLQGPDIFFFFGAHTDNPVVRFGEHLHSVSAAPFFANALSVIRQKGRMSREYAYLCGFVCHFILDSECHPYVEAMIKETDVQHLEIEEEFEKFLLKEDGKDPIGFPVATLVPTDLDTAQAIQPFYPVKSQRFRSGSQKEYLPLGVIRQSLSSMKWIKRLLTAPQPWKQDTINRIMKLSGDNYKYAKGLMNQREDNPACEVTNEGLKARFDAAVPLAAEMIRSLDGSIRTGRGLNKRFDRTFS
ncbi:MAG: zinc dependent phospholipase C family protein [Lachnospiraceae bacterium]|nr:zinc dependent phospholipase C family protein [Lachnospiraceae bacterium]